VNKTTFIHLKHSLIHSFQEDFHISDFTSTINMALKAGNISVTQRLSCSKTYCYSSATTEHWHMV